MAMCTDSSSFSSSLPSSGSMHLSSPQGSAISYTNPSLMERRVINNLASRVLRAPVLRAAVANICPPPLHLPAPAYEPSSSRVSYLASFRFADARALPQTPLILLDLLSTPRQGITLPSSTATLSSNLSLE